MAVEIKITDDGTRRALRFAIWDRLHDELGDGTGEFYDLSRAAVVAEDTDETEAVEMVVGAALDAEQITVANVGEKVMLTIPQDALIRGLDMCMSCLREDERFWDDDPDVRDLRMETFDAAKRLLRVLSPVEVAS